MTDGDASAADDAGIDLPRIERAVRELLLAIGEDPSGGPIVLKDGPIHSAKDLNGSTIPSPSLRDYFEVADRAWIDANGGDSKTVKFIELPVSAMFAALQTGRVAAIGLPNPFLANAIAWCTTPSPRMTAANITSWDCLQANTR